MPFANSIVNTPPFLGITWTLGRTFAGGLPALGEYGIKTPMGPPISPHQR